MADNVQLNAGAGGQTLRTDDVGGFQYQMIKLGFGGDGVAQDVLTTNGLPVNQQTGATWAISAASLPLPTGAATAAKQPALGTSGAASADVITVQGILGMTPVQIADNGGSITVDGTVSITANSAVNVAQVGGNNVNTGSGAAGTGTQRVILATDQPAVPVSQSGSWTLAANQSVNVAQINGATPLMGNGASGTGAQRVTLASDSTGVLATVSTVTTLSQFGGQAINLGNGTVGAGTLRVTVASDSTGVLGVNGSVAHDSPSANNPVQVAGTGRSTDYTAVSDGDVARTLLSLLGKQVSLPYALPGNTWNYAAAAGGLVTTGGVTAKAAAGAGIRNYISSIQVINSHQTIGTEVVVRDGAAGTVLHRGWAQAAGGGYACKFDPPLRGTANTLVEIAEITATATAGVLVNLQGYVAAE